MDTFDATHGTETATISSLWFDRLFRRKECSRYQGVDETWFKEAVEGLPSWKFIDMGCGKGKALILAHESGFRSGLIGVEFSAQMCRVAESNLRCLQIPATVLEMDAAEFRFPDDPCVVFFYNPFGAELMRKVAANMGNGPRIVVYVNPTHQLAFQSFRALCRKSNFSAYANY